MSTLSNRYRCRYLTDLVGDDVALARDDSTLLSLALTTLLDVAPGSFNRTKLNRSLPFNLSAENVGDRQDN